MRNDSITIITASRNFTGNIAVEGKYTSIDGQVMVETAYVVKTTNNEKAKILENSFGSGEESVLEIAQDRGWLLFRDGNEKYLGKICYSDSEPSGDWTKVGDRYFTFKK